MSCAVEDCGDPRCAVCSVPVRFPGQQPHEQAMSRKAAAGLRENAKALTAKTQPKRAADPKPNRSTLW